MEHRWDPHAEVICPYDETHVLSVKRFQRHLVKCRQNHPDKDFVSCPFNAMHMILRSELRKHLAKCVDRVSLDDDVLQDRDPETGEEFRLKGKTDMPRAPEIVEVENDDWDDEIEENLSLKLAEQEEYIRLQGLLARAEEEPLLRRPNFDSTPKPIFPVHNQPVFADYENCTALRRPNLATNEAVPDNERKVQTGGGKSKGTEMTLEERCELINKGILSLETLQLSTDVENSPQSDCDNESIASDSTWVSSIYEPIKRNTSNKNKQEKKTDGLPTKLACKGVARTEQKPKPGISRGQLLKALENSLSSSSRTILANKDSREDSSSSLNKKEDPIQKPKQGMGRGFFKMAALDFQKPS